MDNRFSSKQLCSASNRIGQALLLLIFCVIGIVATSITQGYADNSISSSQIEEALLERGWASFYAREFSRVRITYKDLSSLQYSPMAVTYEHDPWYTSEVYIDPERGAGQVSSLIEHELHHLADWRVARTYKTDNIASDYFSLGTSYRSVAIYSKLPRDYTSIIHYNHDLIYSLDYDYRKLPEWYVAKYFYYADPNWRARFLVTPTPKSTPTPQATPKPSPTRASVTQGNTTRRIYLPRMDLKIVT